MHQDHDPLSALEKRTLGLLVQGFTAKEIGCRLNRDTRHIEYLKRKMKKLLKMKRTPQLINYAITNRLGKC